MNTPSPESTPHSYNQQPPYHGMPYGVPYYAGHAEDPSGLLGSISLYRLIRVFRKKWVTILLALVFAGVATTFYLMTTPKVYKATSLVELSVRRPRIMTQQAAVIEDQGAGVQSEEIFNTRLEKFKGQTMQNAAIARYRKQHPESRMTDQELEKAYENNLTLTLMRRTRLVKVEFMHTDPQFAAAACTAFAEAAEASVYDENRIASDAAVVWLEAQATTQRAELGKADDTLLKYRQENKIDVLESQRKTVDDALMDFNKVLVDLESQEAKERDLLNALNTISLTPESAGRLPASIPRGDEIKAAIDKWMTAVADRDAMLSRYTPKHPEVEARNKMAELYRNQAQEVLSRSKATSASNLELFRQQADSIRKKKSEQSELASELELQIVERRTKLTALERTRDACDAAYRGILSRIQEARMAADENTATVKIVERAVVPERPFGPHSVRIISLAVVLGVVVGLGLGLLTDHLEDHITGAHDVEAGMGIKVLAMVPHVKSRDRREIALATINQRFSEVAETFAGLRTMLSSSQYKDHSKVVLIASSVPEEGKTITSCNLAAALAKNGRRTLLIDFDLRRPRIAGIFFNAAGDAGFAQFPTPAGGGGGICRFGLFFRLSESFGYCESPCRCGQSG